MTLTPDWAHLGVAEGDWPAPLPDVVLLASARGRAFAWWHPGIVERVVCTDHRPARG